MSVRGIGLIRPRIDIIEEPFECVIESPGSPSHGVCWSVSLLLRVMCFIFYVTLRELIHGVMANFSTTCSSLSA